MEYAGPPLIVMGVSGCGKSTVGALLGERLGIPFTDGDDLHPQANKDKMGAGQPLDDDDRRPWLAGIGETLRESLAEGRPSIVACSALKRAYRDLLRGDVPGLVFVHLAGDEATIASRLAGRSHEYMPASLLASQLTTLEPLQDDEPHVVVDLRLTPEEMVERIAADPALAPAPAPAPALRLSEGTR